MSVLVGLLGGAAIGLAYFGSLWFSVGWLVGGGAARALLLQIARFLGLGAGLLGLVHFGACALLAGALAALAMRGWLIRALGAEP